MFRRSESSPETASQRHPFVEPEDPDAGLAFAAAAVQTPGFSPAAAPLDDETVPEAVCAKPGCGRLRDDPIHDVEA